MIRWVVYLLRIFKMFHGITRHINGLNGIFSYIYGKLHNVGLNGLLEVTCDFFLPFLLCPDCTLLLSTVKRHHRPTSPIWNLVSSNVGNELIILLHKFLVNRNFIPKYTILFFPTVLWASRCCNSVFLKKLVRCFLFHEMRFSSPSSPLLVRSVTFQNSSLCWKVSLKKAFSDCITV